jgi:hypothetical protein
MLVFQLSTTCNPNVVPGDPDPRSLEPLVELLERTYPRDHRCVLVHSGAHVLETSERREIAISDLVTAAADVLWRRPTLYVPPVQRS